MKKVPPLKLPERLRLHKPISYWIELATLEKALLALAPISRIVPTTRTRITASITAYSAISCPASSDHTLRIKLDILSLQSIHLFPLSDGRSAIDAPHNAPPCKACQSWKSMKSTHFTSSRFIGPLPDHWPLFYNPPVPVLHNLRVTLEMIKWEHSIFALPFALCGAMLAASGLPPAHQLLWIVIAMLAARSAAMAFNRLADASIDAANPRTRTRALPAGHLSPAFVTAFITVSCAIFILAAAQLNLLTLFLSP